MRLRGIAASTTFSGLQLPDLQLQVYLVLCLLLHFPPIALRFFQAFKIARQLVEKDNHDL